MKKWNKALGMPLRRSTPPVARTSGYARKVRTIQRRQVTNALKNKITAQRAKDKTQATIAPNRSGQARAVHHAGEPCPDSCCVGQGELNEQQNIVISHETRFRPRKDSCLGTTLSTLIMGHALMTYEVYKRAGQSVKQCSCSAYSGAAPTSERKTLEYPKL